MQPVNNSQKVFQISLSFMPLNQILSKSTLIVKSLKNPYFCAEKFHQKVRKNDMVINPSGTEKTTVDFNRQIILKSIIFT